MQIVKMLIKAGEDVHLPNAPRAPVLQAAMYGRAEILELLLTHKCDPNVRNEWQQNGLHLLAHQQVRSIYVFFASFTFIHCCTT